LSERGRVAIPLPERPAPRDRTEANLQDIDDLKRLPDFDRSFPPEARSAFVRQSDSLAAGSITPEITIGWRLSDYAAGRVTLLETVSALRHLR